MAVAMLGTGVSASALAQDPDVEKYNAVVEKYGSAAELIGAKQFDQAIPVLEAVVSEGLDAGPDAAEIVSNAQKILPQAYFQSGLNQAKLENWDEAISLLQKAVDKGELYGVRAAVQNSRTMIGRAYTAMAGDAFNNKDYAKAAEIFAKGYEADPNNTDLALNLAKSYAEMKDYENANKVYGEVMALTHSKYEDAVAQAKTDMQYYQSVAVSDAISTGDQAAADKMMEDILATDPANAVINLMLIQTATNQQKWDRVIQYGEKAAEAQTDEELKSNAWFLLGAAYQNKENKAKAIETYRKVTVGPNVATAKAQIAALSK